MYLFQHVTIATNGKSIWRYGVYTICVKIAQHFSSPNQDLLPKPMLLASY